MDDILHSLPIWGILVLGIVWVIVREVVPRINRVRERPSPMPPPVQSVRPTNVSQQMPAVAQVQVPQVPGGVPLVKHVDETIDRFEALLERHFELDRQQLELLRLLTAQSAQQDRVLGQVADTLSEVKGSVRSIVQLQESMLRLVREDTGRFNTPGR